MSDTPIADQLAADLGMPWVLHGHVAGDLTEPVRECTSRWFDPGAGGAPEGCGLGPVGPHPPLPHMETQLPDETCPTWRSSG